MSIARITVTTNLAAAAGALMALFVGWYHGGKPQLPWGLNGALAGLVSITAPTAVVTPFEAIIIGAIGGIIMYIGVNTLERLGIDDVVGASVGARILRGLGHAFRRPLYGGRRSLAWRRP